MNTSGQGSDQISESANTGTSGTGDVKYVAVSPGDERLPGAVFRSELDAITLRRATYGIAPVDPAGLEHAGDINGDPVPHVDRGLVGLALSGGGIRSATFSLGVVQAFARGRVLPLVDYLSTVSGGGYLGGCISSIFATAPEPDACEIILSGVPAGVSVRGGVRGEDGTWTVSGTVPGTTPGAVPGETQEQGIALVLPADGPRSFNVSACARAMEAPHEDNGAVPAVVRPRGVLPAGVSCKPESRGDIGSVRIDAPDCADELVVPLALALDAFPFQHRVGEAEGTVFRHLRDWSNYLRPRQFLAGLRMPAFFLRGLVVNFLILLPMLLTATLLTLWVVGGPLQAAMMALQGQAAVLPDGSDPVTALYDRVFGTLRWTIVAGLGALALFPLVQWGVERGLGTSWIARDWLGRHVAGGVVLAMGLVTFVVLQPIAILWLDQLGSARIDGIGDGAEATTMAVALLLGVGVLFSGPLAGRASGVTGRVGLTVLGLAGPVIVWLFYLNLCRWALMPETVPAWLAAKVGLLDGPFGNWAAGVLSPVLTPLGTGWSWPAGVVDVALVYATVAVVAFAVTRLFYDVNATSFHRFYRDRLSRAYLIDPWCMAADGMPAHNDGQKLSRLDQRRAPYHLVNTTLNIQTSKRGNLRGRGGAFFTFSRNFIGGPLTGYRATREMEHLHPNLDLGTAVAVSGAAASPNMGSETQRRLTFILSLLNVRLGYWLHHPARFNSATYRVPVVGRIMRGLIRPLSRVTPAYLLREMLGRLDETGAHINLTDGGHLENLGLYELLRRRCRLIIACDGEADPAMTFKGLSNALRLARIDLGVNVEIDVEPLRIDPATDNGVGGWSRRHAVVGRIHYGGGDYGYILYIKSSMTGDEPVTIRKYRDDDPTFPHQTTADQFFDEAQFEAYRALGYHVGDTVLRDILPDMKVTSDAEDIVAVFRAHYESGKPE